MDSSEIDNTKQYTFVSNHRDIVLDSAFLSKLLIDNGFATTCEIAIGDNLLSLPWVRDLARLNKKFHCKAWSYSSRTYAGKHKDGTLYGVCSKRETRKSMDCTARRAC